MQAATGKGERSPGIRDKLNGHQLRPGSGAPQARPGKTAAWSHRGTAFRGRVTAARCRVRGRTDRLQRPLRPDDPAGELQDVDGAVVFRTEADSALVADLRTGISDAEYRVAFEVDEIDNSDRTGWSVMIQGPAHYLEEPEERAGAEAAGVDPWIGGDKETYISIRPALVSGRRIRRA